MMGFLRLLLTRYRNLLDRLAPRQSTGETVIPTTTDLAADERLTRFLYSRSHYSPRANKAKPSAFNPAPYDELSTAHITYLADNDIWRLSRAALGTQPGRDKIHARADLEVLEVHKQQLEAVRDNDPFERHTVIVGWPKLADVSDQKERRLAIALALSQAATLHIRATPVTTSEAETG